MKQTIVSSKLSVQLVLDRVRHLPVLPAVVVEVLAMADMSDVNIGTLAEKLARDQALTAKTLRLANSPFYGLRTRVLTARDAITVLGLTSVRMLVTTVGLMGNLRAPASDGFDFQAFSRHCIATGIGARLLARHASTMEDVAFTAGLLHDIGRLALISHFPDAYFEATARIGLGEKHLLAAEKAALGVDHVEVGAALAKHWNFAPLMVDAIAGYHSTGNADAVSLAGILHVADAVAHKLDSGDADVSPPSEEDWGPLAMSDSDRQRFHTDLDVQLASVSAILLRD